MGYEMNVPYASWQRFHTLWVIRYRKTLITVIPAEILGRDPVSLVKMLD